MTVVFLAVYLLSGVLGYVFAAVSVPAGEIRPEFAWGWMITDGGIRAIRILPALHLAGLIVFFSLVVSNGVLPGSSSGSTGLFPVLRSTVISVLVLSFVYALLSGVLYPRLVAAREAYRVRTVLFENLLEKGRQAVRDKDPTRAVEYFRMAQSVVPADEDVRDEYLEAEQRYLERPFLTEHDEDTRGDPSRMRDATGSEILERSIRALDEQDFYTAHYYATLAQRYGGVASTEAGAIQAQARNAIESQGSTLQEQNESRIYERKKIGYALLVEHNDPVEGYYVFRELAREVPEDPDVKRWYAAARDAAMQQAYFLDEVTGVDWRPGRHEFFFRNNPGNAEYDELVYIDRVVEAPEGTFLFGIEVLRLGKASGVVYHMTAEYGKLINSHVVLRGIDRERRGEDLLPVYHQGEAPAGLPSVLDVFPDRVQLMDIPGLYRPEEASLPVLMRLAGSRESFGYPKHPVRVELALRLLQPAGLIIMSFFAVAVAWAFRSRYFVPPVKLIVPFVIVVPVVTYGSVHLWVGIMRSVGVRMFGVLGFPSGMFLLGVIQAVLIFISLFVMAVQKGET
jgi:hypothetical protein